MRRFPAPVPPATILLVLLIVASAIPHTGFAEALEPPVLRSPAPGATVTTLTFAWDAVPDATEYGIEVRAMQIGVPLDPPVWEATTHFTTITPRDVSNIPQGALSWQVRAIDSDGHRSAWSQSQLIYQIAVPALVAPADGASLTAEQPTRFEWTAAAGAQSYEIDVATDAGFNNNVWSATTSDTSIVPPYPVGIGELYWRVRGRAPGGHTGPGGPARSFTRSVGAPQNLVGPEGSTPAFAWDGAAGASAYNIQVSTASDFGGTPLWEADTVNTSITPVSTFPRQALRRGQGRTRPQEGPQDTAFGTETRYWRVRARDAGGFTSAWADGGSFSLTSPGGVETLELQSPEPDAVLRTDPTFRWQRIEDAVGYALEVSTSPSFEPLYDQVSTTFNSYTPFSESSPSNLEQSGGQRRTTYANGTYYWRVRAIIPSGDDILSEEWRFTKAATIHLIEPVGGATLGSDPTFRWDGMAGAHHYALILGINPTFEPVWDTVRLGNTSYVPYGAATDEQETYANGSYYWKIEALGSDDATIATSDVASFAKSTWLNLVAPADGAVQPGTPTFAWSPVSGAYRYRLTVNSGPDFATVYDQLTTGATQYTPYSGEGARAAYSDGTYQWKVAALDNLGQVITRSESRQLTIGDVIATPPATATRTSTPSPTTTPTDTALPTWTPSPTFTPTRTLSPTPSRTATPAPSSTFTPTTQPTATSSATPSPSPSPTATQGPTYTPSPTRTAGPSPTAGLMPPTPTPPAGGRTDTDEPNDNWMLAARLQPGVHRSYISHERDLDWFKIFVEQPHSVLRITMPHPPADYDLALVSDPATSAGTLTDIGPLTDLGDVNQTGRLGAPEHISDIGTLQDARPVRAISARPGLRSEMVVANVFAQPGWYYVLVKGYNGAHFVGARQAGVGARQVGLKAHRQMNLLSDLPRPYLPRPYQRHQSGLPRPYTLEVEIDPPEDSRQCTVTSPHPPGVIVARWTASETPETLILVNKRRMDAYFGGPGSTDDLLTALRSLADHPDVNGVVEPVENNPEVTAAYNAWDDDACNPDAANRVTEAIKLHIDETRQVYPTIRQVLIVGNDDIIPFHRVPDEVNVGNESEYLSQVDANPDSPFYSSMERGYILTDDFYVDDEPLAWRGRRLFVPDRPIGRLVETPQEIIRAIETFLEMDSNLALESGLVLGYDFSSDSAAQIANILRSAGINVDSLIATGWTGADLRDSLLNTHHDVSVVNARFSHNEATSQDQAGGPLTAEEVAEVGGELRRSLFLSIGSHAGLNVPDRWAGAADRLDFSQALNGWGVSSVANTGFGYGVAQADDFSELLMTCFTEELVGTPDVTVGRALMRAKQRFFRGAGPASFGLYHEKALIESTLFGIPGLRITVPDLAAPSGNLKQVTAESMEAAGEDLFKRTIRLEPQFARIDMPAGSYFAADDGTISQPGRPVQPRFTWGIQEPELFAHGALWTAATYTELRDFDPVITHPLTDTTGPEPGFPFGVWTPARLHTINRLSTADGTSEELVVLPGQFRNQYPASGLTFGVERRYDSLTYDLYYSTSPDWTPPIIWQVRYEKTALGAEFWVDVTDPSSIERVVVTYTTGDGEWETAELQLVAGFSWQALMPFFEPDTLDFIIQAVDGAGNVALSVDKGRLFGRRSHTFYLLPVMRQAGVWER